MRMYIVAGAVGSGIIDVIGDLWEELFSRGFRSTRLVYGRPDRVDLNSTDTAEEFIAMLEQDLVSRTNTIDVIVTGNFAAKFHREIRARWPEESKIIFVRKSDKVRGIEAGLCLLENHTSYDRELYTGWMSSQIDDLDQSVVQLGASWVDVDINNMFTFNTETLSESDNMVADVFVCNEYAGSKSADCIIRQLAIY